MRCFSGDIPLFKQATLPLICPQCLRFGRGEQLLSPIRVCSICSAIYPVREGVPILLNDPQLRKAFAEGETVSDRRTQFYQENAGYLREHGEHENIEQALSMASADGIVLEVGAGSGAFAGVGGTDYCALDYSFTFLHSYLSNYRCICASADAIPLPSGSCRMVFSVATLEHVPRADLAFEEVDRVLSPGGVAYLEPAWHCRDWAAEGLNVRSYSDLTLKQKIRKALVPLRDSVLYRGVKQIPWRTWRRAVVKLQSTPSTVHYAHLNANYEHFWVSDSYACSSIDSHEGVLFFESRGYELLRPRGGSIARLLFRAGAVIVRKSRSDASKSVRF
jgi:SAM-dependent methyltransferase